MRKQFVFALALTVVSTLAVAYAAYRQLHLSALLSAWMLTLAHGTVAALINERALRSPSANFFAWGLGMNGIRVLVLLSLIFVAHRIGIPQFMPFLVATLIGYFCFLFTEIWTLHTTTIRTYSADEES